MLETHTTLKNKLFPHFPSSCLFLPANFHVHILSPHNLFRHFSQCLSFSLFALASPSWHHGVPSPFTSQRLSYHPSNGPFFVTILIFLYSQTLISTFHLCFLLTIVLCSFSILIFSLASSLTPPLYLPVALPHFPLSSSLPFQSTFHFRTQVCIILQYFLLFHVFGSIFLQHHNFLA